MKFKFLKYFLGWLALVFFSITSVFFLPGLAVSSLTDLLLGALFLSVMASLIITYIFKWIIEGRLKHLGTTGTETIAQEGGNPMTIDELSSQSFKTSAKTIAIFIAVLAFAFNKPAVLYAPTLILGTFFIYWTIKATTSRLLKNPAISLVNWLMGAVMHGVLLYVALYFIIKFIYPVLYSVWYEFRIFDGIFQLGYFIDPYTFIPLMFPVLLYEWYTSLRNTAGVGTMPKVPIFRFVLIPVAIGLTVFGLLSIGANSEVLAWTIYGLMFTVPLMIIIPSIWIFWREKNRNKETITAIKNEQHVSSSDVEKKGGSVWRSPAVILILVGVFIFGGLYLTIWYSKQQILQDLGYSKGIQSEDVFLEKCIGGKAEPTTSYSTREIISKRGNQNDSTNDLQDTSFDLEFPEGDGEYSYEYYDYGCFDNYLSSNIFNEIFPRASELDNTAKSNLINESIDYCVSLPNKPVNSQILFDQAFMPNLSYSQLCTSIFIDHLTSNDRFTLSLDEFMKKYPYWGTRALKDINGYYFVGSENRVNGILVDKRDFRIDTTNYICGKAYEEGTLSFDTCVSPRIDEYYSEITR